MARKNDPSRAILDRDFDEIMKTSRSEKVLAKYRMSIGMKSFTSVPRTADMSLRTSMSSMNPRNSERDDFWDEAMVSTNSFTGKNISLASSEFTPAEDLEDRLQEDQAEQEYEFCAIPPVQKTNSNETNWQDRTTRTQEMSFGQYFHGTDNIRDIYGNKSPPKRRNRVALVELSNRESPADPARHGLSNLQELISKFTNLSISHKAYK